MRALSQHFCRTIVLVFLILSSVLSFATTQIVPNTTLTAELGNNTSTSPIFTGTLNGNISGNNNISKVDATTLLYPGSTTKIYAHLMAWFGGTSHVNVGYASDDPAQVTRQVDDMLSRGLSGAIIDWYGPNSKTINNASIYVKQEAEKHTNFEFAIMEDKGALNSCAKTAGCDVTSRMIQDLTYAYNTFEQSPTYMRVGGRPLVFFFGTEVLNIDWARARAGVPGNPIFIFRNNSGFTRAQTGGGFSWTGISSDPNNMGLGYLDSFYYTANKYPTLEAFGSSYKGFNDSIASWGQHRLINQQCGQTWLSTMAEAGKYYSSSNQLDAFQLVTWNDYEEGTALETGIDNCASVSASVTGSALSWTISGQPNTIDHYSVFISLDGANLMQLTDLAAATTSLDLGSFSLAPAAYKVFVKAVGKPFLTNKMSAAVDYTVANLPPTVTLNATPTSGTAALLVSVDTSGSKDPDGTISSTKLDFGDGTILNAASGSHSYAKAGAYVLIATVTDDLGATSSTSSTITVAPPRVVTISSPLNNATTTTTVRVTGKATGSTTVTLTQIYVDGIKKFEIAGAYVDKTIAVVAGQHRITVQALDSKNPPTKATVFVTAK